MIVSLMWTVAEVDPSVWTCIEPAMGILAACLSNMRPLLTYVWSNLSPKGEAALNDSSDSHGKLAKVGLVTHETKLT